ncbi:unnamed protein product [Leptosia nina]|uniref:Uncharacterized protein n=1 Tax=Leptosia nina TaxID=320188 RepID=A0AAV1IV70_9NEOP
MYSLSKSIVLLSFVSTLCGQDYDLGDVTLRTLPPEFDFGSEAKVNKTQLEEDLEECMEDYVECFVADRKQNICAINSRSEKKNFNSLCLMEYENCRIKASIENRWRYYHDDNC